MLKKLLNYLIEHGLPLPHAYDPVLKQPSFRLLVAETAFVLAVFSIIFVHFYPETIFATGITLFFFALSMIFYMLKKLQSAKIDLDDKEISLNSEEKTLDNLEEVE